MTQVTFLLRFGISDPQPAQTLDVNLLLLVTMFVKWPTFILGSCDKVAAQGYLDCWQLKLQSPGQAWSMTLGFAFFCFVLFFWCETTCELHNNLIHPHWKHEIHKQGAHKGGLTAFYTYSASFLPISPNWKRYVCIFTVVVSSK